MTILAFLMPITVDDESALMMMTMIVMVMMLIAVRVEWWLTDDGLAPMADSFQSANFVKTEIFHNAAAARTLCY